MSVLSALTGDRGMLFGMGLMKALNALGRGEGADLTPEFMMAQQMKRDDALRKSLSGMGQPTPQGLMQILGRHNPQAALQLMAQQALAQPPRPPAAVQTYEWFENLSPELQQRYMDYQTQLRSAGATSVNVNTGEAGPRIGPIPQGWQAVQEPDGGWTMEPIPGGPEARKITAAEGAEKRKGAATERQADVVLEDVDRALNKLKSSPFWTTGVVGTFMQEIPGTEARNLAELITTITANVGFDRLQQMREASPTGGALGQVSERELTQLNAAIGSLSQAQDADQLRENLERVARIYTEIIHGPAAVDKQPKIEAEKTLGSRRFIKRGGKWYEVK